jgi:hypothetical protein
MGRVNGIDCAGFYPPRRPRLVHEEERATPSSYYYEGIDWRTRELPKLPNEPTGDTRNVRVHPFKRLLKLLWKLLVIVLCISACITWSSACFSCIMAAYCIAGCCINCATRRVGGCHDCPLICDGIERSLAWSLWGCRLILRFTRKIITPRDQWQEIENTSLITPPPRLYTNPTRNIYFVTVAAAFDNVVDDLNGVADRAATSMERGAFNAMMEIADASGPPRYF